MGDDVTRKTDKTISGDMKGAEGALDELHAVEEAGLKIGNSFHAFRFNEGGTVEDALGELRMLEAGELKLGSSFHAFRFNSDALRDLTEIEEKELKLGNAFHAFRFK